MDAIVYRYSLPGLPAAVIFYFVLAESGALVNPEIVGIPIIIALSLLLGYFVHQIWMLVFEFEPLGLSYDSPKREVLRKIGKLIERQQEKNRSKQQKEDAQLYPLWESFLYYDKMPSAFRKKDRRMWHSYHTNMGNAIGIVLGGILLLLYPGVRDLFFPNAFVSSLALGSVALVLCGKARVTRGLVDELEMYWVQSFFKDFLKRMTDGKVPYLDDHG